LGFGANICSPKPQLDLPTTAIPFSFSYITICFRSLVQLGTISHYYNLSNV
ncbi:hypothetical protein ACJX0J_027552, partial [Zea mays]